MASLKQRPNSVIINENDHIRGKVVHKNDGAMKRSVLKDLGTNKINGSRPSGLPHLHAGQSKLPILKKDYKGKKTILSQNENVIKNVSSCTTVTGCSTAMVQPKKLQSVKSLIEKTKQMNIELIPKQERKETTLPAGVPDIDSEDRNNPLLVSEYANDIHEYLKTLEVKFSVQNDFLKEHVITPKMRSTLIDWLVEVQQEYNFTQETLHLAVGVFDRYLQANKNINRKQLQLIGVGALYLAVKYEETLVPELREFVYISASAFTEDQLLMIEVDIFKTIGFSMSRPVPLTFLRRYSKAAGATPELHTFAKYFLDLSLVEYKLSFVNPSLIAAGSLCLALFICSEEDTISETLWTQTMEYYSGYSLADIKFVVNILASEITVSYTANNTNKLKAVMKKYAKPCFLQVSLSRRLFSDRVKHLIEQ